MRTISGKSPKIILEKVVGTNLRTITENFENNFGSDLWGQFWGQFWNNFEDNFEDDFVDKFKVNFVDNSGDNLGDNFFSDSFPNFEQFGSLSYSRLDEIVNFPVDRPVDQSTGR